MRRPPANKTKDIPVEVVASTKLNDAVWVQAQSTGTANLANKSLTKVPAQLIELPVLNFDKSPEWWSREQLKKVDLSHNSITEIPDHLGTPEIIESLKCFLIAHNQLQKVSKCIFTLVNLVKLDLSHNQLSSLDFDFSPLVHLEDLQIGNNLLSSIPASIGSCAKLERFDASHNKLAQIPSELSKLQRIRILSLQENLIEVLPASLFNNYSLATEIYLSHNKLSLSPSLKNLMSLQRLDLRYNKITLFPLLESELIVKDILLGFNNIQNLAANYHFLEKINFIDLSNNRIESIPQEFTSMKTLETLDLRNNSIKSLPTQLGAMNLKKLSLGGNILKSVPSEILNKGNMPLIEYLKKRAEPSPDEISRAAPTQTATVSEILKKLLGNSILNLSDQDLNQIPEPAFELVLTKLNLSRNKFVEFPANLNKFQNLVSVDLSFNKISLLSDSLLDCKQLEELNLSNNQFKTINGNLIQKMSSLKYFIINNNALSELPEEILLAPNLLSLQAGQNQIKQIPSTLATANKLTDLNLANNKLVSIDASAVLKCKTLNTLDISNNDIASLDPTLGLCEHLQSLNLVGNPIKSMVRILDKKTSQILLHLRNRIVQ